MHCKGEKGRIQPINPEPLRDKSKDCDAAVTIQWLVADVTWFRESLLFLQMILTSSKFSLKGVPSKSESEDQKIPKRQKITSQSNRKSQIDWKSSSEPSNHMRFQRISKAGGSIELLNNKHSACPGKRVFCFFLSREHQTSNIKSGILLFHLILESDYIYTPVKSNPPPQAVFATLSEQILIWKLERKMDREGILTPDNPSFFVFFLLVFFFVSCHPSWWGIETKPVHQVAASHGDTYCLRAAASSPRGVGVGGAGMKEGGG